MTDHRMVVSVQLVPFWASFRWLTQRKRPILYGSGGVVADRIESFADDGLGCAACGPLYFVACRELR